LVLYSPKFTQGHKMQEKKAEVPNESPSKNNSRFWLHIRVIGILLIGIGIFLWGMHGFILNKFALFEKVSTFDELSNIRSLEWDFSEPLWVTFYGLLLCFCAAGDFLWNAIIKNRH
jgi:hypothetical protein